MCVCVCTCMCVYVHCMCVCVCVCVCVYVHCMCVCVCVCVLNSQSGDEVDAAVREVNRLLGEAVVADTCRGGSSGSSKVTEKLLSPLFFLKVERRYVLDKLSIICITIFIFRFYDG